MAYRIWVDAKVGRITSLIQDAATLDAYVRAFGRSPESGAESEEDARAKAERAARSLVDQHYHWASYVLPAALFFILTVSAVAISFLRAGVSMGLPPEFEALVRGVPLAAIAGVAGAYLWGLFDILQRYRSEDMAPSPLHFIWLRLLVAPIVGALATSALVEPIASLAAFGVGTFPVKTLRNFAKTQAAEHLKIETTPVPAEAPTLHQLQGLTREVIERLEEENLRSVQHLANADPVRLLLRTNLEWKVILDMIDQAILFNYLGPEGASLRSMGIRGAIELAEIGDCLKESVESRSPTKDWPALIKQIAKDLNREQAEDAVWNLIGTLLEDPQVDFVWRLWGETAPTSAPSEAQ
jgi:hypothetical protein